MNQNQTKIQLPNFTNRKPFYNNLTDYDFFVIYNNKLFYLHQQYLTESKVLQKIIQQHEMKFYIIDNDEIKIETFQQVIKCLYGFDIQFQRTWDIIPIINLINILKIQSVKNLFLQDIQNNQDQYGFFLNLSMAVKFEFSEFKEKCISQLVCLGFEQLNYNLVDFFHCQFSVVKMVALLYIKQYLKQNNENLISLKNMKRVIKKYYKHHSLQLKQSTSLIKLLDQLDDNEQQNSIDNFSNYSSLIFIKGGYFEDQIDNQQEQISSLFSKQKKSRITYLAQQIIMRNRRYQGNIQTIKTKVCKHSASTNNTIDYLIKGRKQLKVQMECELMSDRSKSSAQFSDEQAFTGNIYVLNRQRTTSFKRPLLPQSQRLRRLSFQEE